MNFAVNQIKVPEFTTPRERYPPSICACLRYTVRFKPIQGRDKMNYGCPAVPEIDLYPAGLLSIEMSGAARDEKNGR